MVSGPVQSMPCYSAHLKRDLSKLLHAVPRSKSTALMVFRTRRLLLGIVFHGPVQCGRYLMWALHQPFLSYRCVAEAAEGRYQLSGLLIQKVAIKDSHPLPTMRRLHQMHIVNHCVAIKSQIHWKKYCRGIACSRYQHVVSVILLCQSTSMKFLLACKVPWNIFLGTWWTKNNYDPHHHHLCYQRLHQQHHHHRHHHHHNIITIITTFVISVPISFSFLARPQLLMISQ